MRLSWQRGLAAIGLSGLVACGQFGLPTGRSDGDIERGDPTILDVDPKVASAGSEALSVSVVGIDTFFDATAEVELPLLPDVEILSVEALSVEQLEVILTIPDGAEGGTSPLVVTTERDGTLTFDDGFTVVP